MRSEDPARPRFLASVGGLDAEFVARDIPPFGSGRFSIASADPTPDQSVYDPGNPAANAQGYVKMPNVNPVNEMVDMIDESRSYQSDVTAMSTAKQMYEKTLDLLK